MTPTVNSGMQLFSIAAWILVRFEREGIGSARGDIRVMRADESISFFSHEVRRRSLHRGRRLQAFRVWRGSRLRKSLVTDLRS